VPFKETKFSPKIEAIEFKNCENLQKFPIENFNKSLKLIKIENCNQTELVLNNEEIIENFNYHIKNKLVHAI
jgi:hypothetical protein